MQTFKITGEIVDAAMKVHTALGPGLLESVYEACLAFELRQRGLRVQQQVQLPVHYCGLTIEAGYRMDLLVENAVVVELKAIESMLPIHKAQLLSYLRMSGYEVGLLLNFNVVHLRNGIERVINSRTPASSDAVAMRN
ncbi:MAG TPA: GxxExxY protein [Terriglobales bacterium]|nr:GxxExxY protein [Terriglobales bacterium]